MVSPRVESYNLTKQNDDYLAALTRSARGGRGRRKRTQRRRKNKSRMRMKMRGGDVTIKAMPGTEMYNANQSNVALQQTINQTNKYATYDNVSMIT